MMSKVYDGVMGLVVGDALGVPVEFCKRDSFHITDMTGYGTHYEPAGTWSDDSSMALATLESIVFNRDVVPDDIMNNFALWFCRGAFTPYGRTFGVGNICWKAIERYLDGVEPERCGGKRVRDNGNGALMRILPLAFTKCDDDMVDVVSGLTHAHPISRTACRIYVHVARKVLNGERLDDILRDIDPEMPEFNRLKHLGGLRREEIKSTGYVVDTLEAALWCVLNSKNYRECVLMAVNLGEDTDTVAAVAGGLAGIMYGTKSTKGIPKRWIAQIARREWIKHLCEQLFFV